MIQAAFIFALFNFAFYTQFRIKFSHFLSCSQEPPCYGTVKYLQAVCLNTASTMSIGLYTVHGDRIYARRQRVTCRPIRPTGSRRSRRRVRTILALGYWVLPNIFKYWVVLGIGQYFYWLSYPIPILLGNLDTSCQQMTAGKLGRR